MIDVCDRADRFLVQLGLNRGAVRRRWEGAMIEEHLNIEKLLVVLEQGMDAFDHSESPEYYFGGRSLMKMATLGRVKRLAVP